MSVTAYPQNPSFTKISVWLDLALGLEFADFWAIRLSRWGEELPLICSKTWWEDWVTKPLWRLKCKHFTSLHGTVEMSTAWWQVSHKLCVLGKQTNFQIFICLIHKIVIIYTPKTCYEIKRGNVQREQYACVLTKWDLDTAHKLYWHKFLYKTFCNQWLVWHCY